MGIRVFIVDDHPMTRAGLLATLEREADFEVVGTAADGIAAWNIIGGYAGYISLGHNVFYAIGGYVAGTFLVASAGGVVT